jgi:Family of unknown function (DUF5709)
MPGGMSENIGEDPGDSTTENETYNTYSVDDEDQPQGEGYGNTPYEEEVGESLDQRIAQEEPEPDPYEEAATEVENVSGEVGNERAGRLVDEDQGLGPDEEKDLVGEDVGIDGAGASAEEAAVHVIDDDR